MHRVPCPILGEPIIPLTSLQSSAASLDGLTGWVVTVVDTIGELGVALLIALENVFPPIRSEVILPLAGFTAGQPGSAMSWLSAVAAATAGSLLGAWILYGLGYWFGRERTRKFLLWLPLTKASDVDRTEAWFDAHGKWTVFFGRMIPVFRSLISLPAGVVKMNVWAFTLLTTVGSAIWNIVLITAGYYLGANWTVVRDYVGYVASAVVVLLVVTIIWWIIHRVRQNRMAA